MSQLSRDLAVFFGGSQGSFWLYFHLVFFSPYSGFHYNVYILFTFRAWWLPMCMSNFPHFFLLPTPFSASCNYFAQFIAATTTTTTTTTITTPYRNPIFIYHTFIGFNYSMRVQVVWPLPLVLTLTAGSAVWAISICQHTHLLIALLVAVLKVTAVFTDKSVCIAYTLHAQR